MAQSQATVSVQADGHCGSQLLPGCVFQTKKKYYVPLKL